MLAIHANEVVSSDRLIDVLWDERPPDGGSHTLQTMVSRLPRTVGADRVETVAPGYRLRVEPAEVDTGRFEELVRAGLGAADRSEVAAGRLEEALALWRGRPYAEFADDEFAPAEVVRLEELRACAVEERAAALIELGRPVEVIGALDAEVRGAPFRERLRGVLMLALARAGRPVEALRVFEAYRWLLADEVGVQSLPCTPGTQRRHRASASRPRLGASLRRRRDGRGPAERHGDLPVHRSLRRLDPTVAGAWRRHGRGVGPPRRHFARRDQVAPGAGGQDNG